MATIAMAVATVIIAWYAYCNYRLYKTMQEKEIEYKEQISDLYQAIVIATLMSGPTSFADMGKTIEAFNSYYKGKTKIF